ncbi:DUF2318 domain-containing protein [Candidatus Woesearchaeota archaeon]|jgi:uncharacterized membrane protein|nr:DUF2318 domain-containing protein [Candidatus Woesearchaeota archaeon]MBT5397051.1 DUF2318 domain-containing protein [Candidatus Woesearchaeota archaeon]MBT5924204.1 DUF2318 domain-containing protein [Candidatus Woesearchaeota archaeon]MBT6367403.1 DUF2318 domain-containing protein [Candidatus Woesearchaeota archaeon]MBT7762451.1 DUF2318 domain-containing protein [Candidatus Woesearchaeota archaeon]
MKQKILISGLLLVGLLLIVGCSGKSSAPGPDGVVTIPIEQVSETVQKYTYDANGVAVTYFAVIGSDGNVRTAFDACDVCGGSKGYEQQGTDIKCRNCGKVFRIDGLGTKNKGYGCWPSFLSHYIEDGNIVISKAELAAGASRFV